RQRRPLLDLRAAAIRLRALVLEEVAERPTVGVVLERCVRVELVLRHPQHLVEGRRSALLLAAQPDQVEPDAVPPDAGDLTLPALDLRTAEVLAIALVEPRGRSEGAVGVMQILVHRLVVEDALGLDRAEPRPRLRDAALGI